MTSKSSGLTGSKELQQALKKFGANAEQALVDIVNGTAQNVRSNAVKAVQRGAKSGTTYQKYQPRRTHRASAPGQAPATDTGRLVGSITASINGKTAEVSASAEYATFLEFGTQDMEARPFLFPALEKERPAWDRRLSKVVEAAAKGLLK